MDAADAEARADSLWAQALDQAAAKQRILVLGPTDAGKSTFIRKLVRETEAALIDLDPGQKMIGAPGTATLGRLDPERLERMIFVGTTSASALGAIARAGAELAGTAGGPFVVNTAGFVRGLGQRLQTLTAASVAPDLIVEIGGDAAAPPIVGLDGVPLIRLERSPAAGRKSSAARAAIRQAAFAAALDGAAPVALPGLTFDPAPPVFAAGLYPVCALADAEGKDMAIGILRAVAEGSVLIDAPPHARPVDQLRLGKMWAAPDGKGGWRLLEQLKPAWRPAEG